MQGVGRTGLGDIGKILEIVESHYGPRPVETRHIEEVEEYKLYSRR